MTQNSPSHKLDDDNRIDQVTRSASIAAISFVANVSCGDGTIAVASSGFDGRILTECRNDRPWSCGDGENRDWPCSVQNHPSGSIRKLGSYVGGTDQVGWEE